MHKKLAFTAVKAKFQTELGSVELHAAIRQVEPGTHVLLAVDGAAPLAKLATQRKRRGSASQRKHKGVPGLCATPGAATSTTASCARPG